MSRFSDKLLSKWQRLFAERYNRAISLEETEEMLDRLVSFFEVLGSVSCGDQSPGGSP